MRAFHRAQPRARRQVSSSSGKAARNPARLEPWNSVQAMTRSQAGSPAAELPKSITAASVPARAVEGGERRAGFGGVESEPPAAMEIVWAGHRPCAGIDTVEGRQEVRECH